MGSSILRFSMVASYFRDNISQLERGENSLKSGYVSKCFFEGEGVPKILKGEVKASMKTRTYNVEVSFNEEAILDAICSCPRGQVICHHIAALCLYGHNNISSTDVSCSWSVPAPSNVEEVKCIEDIFPLKEPYKATERPVNQDEIKEFLHKLGNNIVGFKWLLKPEPACKPQLLVDIEDILFSEEFLRQQNKTEYFCNKCAVNEEQISQVVMATVGQSTNDNWLVSRRYRLTASHFGQVLAACKRNSFPKSLFQSLLEGYNLSSVQAIKWGRENEKDAIKTFEMALNKKVCATGFWLNECGFIGASPDGLIEDENALIEIKCPYKYRQTSLSEGLKKDKSYIIYKNENDATEVNEKHSYWDQIQGQLHITGKSTCYLMVWTPLEIEVVIIPKSEDWAKNIDILKKFYLKQFIPHLCGTTL